MGLWGAGQHKINHTRLRFFLSLSNVSQGFPPRLEAIPLQKVTHLVTSDLPHKSHMVIYKHILCVTLIKLWPLIPDKRKEGLKMKVNI